MWKTIPIGSRLIWLSQAEHDENAQAILITNDAMFGQAVAAAVDLRLETLEKRAIASASWREFGAVITVQNMGEAAALADDIAPEHLQLCVVNPEPLAANIKHAGAMFLGKWTPEAIGRLCRWAEPRSSDGTICTVFVGPLGYGFPQTDDYGQLDT